MVAMRDAFAHSTFDSALPTYVTIDDAYAEWYEARFNKPIDRSLVLPVQKAIQGHPKSGHLWEEHINCILFSSKLNFTTTTHDQCIYCTVFQGEEVFLL